MVQADGVTKRGQPTLSFGPNLRARVWCIIDEQGKAPLEREVAPEIEAIAAAI